MKKAAFIVFGLFVAVSVTYVTFQLIIATPLGLYGAIIISGFVFAGTAFLIDRKFIAR